MRILRFTFKNEAMWIMIFSLAPLAIGLLFLLVVLTLHSLH
jgi:hypothetical protein